MSLARSIWVWAHQGRTATTTKLLGPFRGFTTRKGEGGIGWADLKHIHPGIFVDSCHYRWTFSRFFMECIKVDEAEATAWKPSWKCAICDEIPSRVGQIQFVCARYHMLKLHPSRNELPGLSFQIFRIFAKSTSGCLKILGQRFWIKRHKNWPNFEYCKSRSTSSSHHLLCLFYWYTLFSSSWKINHVPQKNIPGQFQYGRGGIPGNILCWHFRWREWWTDNRRGGKPWPGWLRCQAIDQLEKCS